MDIRVLQYFLAVAREESITKAADALHMTQPPLSRAMRDLETELGVALLVRGPKRVTLTEDGLLLRERAQELVDLFEKTRAEVGATDEAVSGDVHIAGAETEAVDLLARAAARLQERQPLIGYRLFSGDAERVFEKLDRGLADFGLLIEPAVDVDRYEMLRLPHEDRWGMLVGADDPLAALPSVTPADVRAARLIVPHRAGARSELAAWMGVDASALSIAGRYDLLYNAARFAREGAGCVFALDGIVDASPDSGLAFVPLDPPRTAGVYLVWKRSQAHSRAARLFLEELRQLVAETGEAHGADAVLAPEVTLPETAPA